MPNQPYKTVIEEMLFAKSLQRQKGKEHQTKTEEEKKQHKQHQLKIKVKRNAKKGIYTRKISYPKKRGKNKSWKN